MPDGESNGGHRERLRDRFLKSGLAGFSDYEIVELLLSLGTPRRDCKQAAKDAIKSFGGLRGVLSASSDELQQIKGIGPRNAFGVKFMQELAREFLKEKLIDKPLQSSSQAIFEYFYHSMRDLKKEVFKVVFMNPQNQIIQVKDLFQGTVDCSAVYIREVIEDAIRCRAVSLVAVHNHPSGNSQPSDSDKELTRDLVYAARVMQMKVLDHIIIGDNRFFSFAAEGLIDRCEMDFLRLKTRPESQNRKNAAGEGSVLGLDRLRPSPDDEAWSRPPD
jgi:DNA repair protein RadC